MEDKARVVVKIDKDKHKRFKVWLANSGKTAQKVLEAMIDKLLG